MSSQTNPLSPTWQGHIASTLDALVLFEASLEGRLTHVPRRPHDRERQDLIKSGSVFIYEEHASGIKRWTDGVSWSPSRILGNFLIYRELEKPFPPGEKKRALKKKKSPTAGVSKSDSSSRPSLGSFSSSMDFGKDAERALIGSLVDSYPFKRNGLVKKTISITYRGVPHHLVSYYGLDDVMSGRLMTPSKDARLRDVVPRMELMTSQNFRAPVDEVEYGPDGAPALFAAVPNGPHDFTSGSILQRAWSGPGVQTMSVPAYPPPAPASFQFPHPPPHNSYVSPMNSSMAVPMASTMPPPSATPLSYAPPPQGNYALDPSRAARLGSGTSIANEFPRNMPTQSPPRRHSAFEPAPPTDLSAMSLGTMAEARPAAGGGGGHSSGTGGGGGTGTPSANAGHGGGGSNAYLSQSYFMPHRPASMAGQDSQTFPSPRRMRMGPNAVGSDDGAAQNYGLDENGSTAWSFDAAAAMDGSHDQQYFGGNGQPNAPSQQWQGNSNSLGR